MMLCDLVKKGKKRKLVGYMSSQAATLMVQLAASKVIASVNCELLTYHQASTLLEAS